MLSQSLASRKRPPRSSWTRSIWRVISTAWVTLRYLWSTRRAASRRNALIHPPRRPNGSRGPREDVRERLPAGPSDSCVVRFCRPTFTRQRRSTALEKYGEPTDENPVFPPRIFIPVGRWPLNVVKECQFNSAQLRPLTALPASFASHLGKLTPTDRALTKDTLAKRASSLVYCVCRGA